MLNSVKGVSWLLAFLLASPAVSRAEAPQLFSIRDAERRDRDASTRARGLGRDSIGRGGRHVHHGRHHHNGGEVHLGSFQIAQGVLGLLAAAAAERMAAKGDRNGNNLDQLPAGAQGGSSGASVAGLGQGDPGVVSGASKAALDAAALEAAESAAKAGGRGLARVDLESPEVKKALAAIEEEYGYTPEQFVRKLESGADVREVFEKAPKNALTADESRAAWKKSRADVSPEPSLAGGAEAPPAASGPAEPGAEPGAARSFSKEYGGLRDALARSLEKGDEEPELSPEVKEALAAREARERKERYPAKPASEMDLFEVVHGKYRERENHLRWGEPLRAL